MKSLKKSSTFIFLVSRSFQSTAKAFTSSSSSSYNIHKSVRMASSSWIPGDTGQAKEAREKLDVWPLDEYNAQLLNEVHPRDYMTKSDPTAAAIPEYDLIAIGSGAGGLVSARQSARRGAKSAMISELLAGGDCLNVGCVPSKALIRSARAVSQVKKASELGVVITGEIKVDFEAVMTRLRRLRAKIAPADGHPGTEVAGAHVYQGRGRLTGPNTVEVNGQTLKFKNCILAMGGRPGVPTGISGLKEAPYTTNENLFNLQILPPRMVILGAGVIALEMAQSFALLGSKVTVINRSSRLFESKLGDEEAAEILQQELEKDGVTFLSKAKVEKVETLEEGDGEKNLPLMKVIVGEKELMCECLVVATGRLANVENCGLDRRWCRIRGRKGCQDQRSRAVS